MAYHPSSEPSAELILWGTTHHAGVKEMYWTTACRKVKYTRSAFWTFSSLEKCGISLFTKYDTRIVGFPLHGYLNLPKRCHPHTDRCLCGVGSVDHVTPGMNSSSHVAILAHIFLQNESPYSFYKTWFSHFSLSIFNTFPYCYTASIPQMHSFSLPPLFLLSATSQTGGNGQGI